MQQKTAWQLLHGCTQMLILQHSVMYNTHLHALQYALTDPYLLLRWPQCSALQVGCSSNHPSPLAAQAMTPQDLHVPAIEPQHDSPDPS